MAQEIERKFRMKGFPDHLTCLRQADIWQGYISVEPEIRIHKAVDRITGKTDYRLTLKGNGTLSRTEIKTDVEKKLYEENRYLVEGKILSDNDQKGLPCLRL